MSFDLEAIKNLKSRIQNLENELAAIKLSLLNLEQGNILGQSKPTGNSLGLTGTTDSSKNLSPAAAIASLSGSTQKPRSSENLTANSANSSQDRSDSKAGKTSFGSPEWEFLMGGNWIAKLGIGAVLLASAWFLDLAFENDWFSDSGKVLFGLGLGFLSIFTGLILGYKKFRILTPSLVGAGATILYLSIFSGYRFYSFFSIQECFAYLVILSTITNLLSFKAKNEAIFFFGYLGLLLSPILLSTGENSYRFLFLYLIAINLSFLYVSKNKGWRWAPFLVITANWTVYSVWAHEKMAVSSFWIPTLFVFFSFFVFLYRELFLEKKTSPIQYDSLVLLVSNIIVAAFSLYELTDFHHQDFVAHSTIAVALVTIFSTFQFQKDQGNLWPVPVLFYLFASLVLFSLTEGFQETTFSFSLIVFAGVFSAIIPNRLNDSKSLLPIFSLFLWFVALTRLIFVESPNLGSASPIINLRFFLYLTAFAGLGLAYYLGRRSRSEFKYSLVYATAAVAVLILGFQWEIHYSIQDKFLRNQGYSFVLLSFSLFFLVLGFRFGQSDYRKIGILLVVLVIGKFIFYDIWFLNLIVKISAGFLLGIFLIVLGLYYEKFKQKILGTR